MFGEVKKVTTVSKSTHLSRARKSQRGMPVYEGFLKIKKGLDISPEGLRYFCGNETR